MGSRRDNPLMFACAHPRPVRVSLPMLPQPVEPALPAKAGEAAVFPSPRLMNLDGSFPPSFPFKAAFSSFPAMPKKGNNLKVTIFSYLSLRKCSSEFGENVHNFPTIAPFDFCQK